MTRWDPSSRVETSEVPRAGWFTAAGGWPSFAAREEALGASLQTVGPRGPTEETLVILSPEVKHLWSDSYEVDDSAHFCHAPAMKYEQGTSDYSIHPYFLLAKTRGASTVQ